MDATTNGNKWQQLSVKQENAIDLLVTGKTDAQVAEAVGVHRVTVTKWRNYHPGFQAELNRRRENVWGASAERLRAMVPKALDAIETAVNGDIVPFPVAVQVLKLAGLESPGAPAGADDVEQIIERLVRERANAIQAERKKHLPLMDRLNNDWEPPNVEQDEADAAAAREQVLAELEARLTEASK